jgi:predicted O-methyltransferase YrrM
MITENLINHKFILRLNKLYHYIFGEKFYKKLDFDWSIHPERYEIIQETIYRKKYKNYLEIGCDNDQLFSKINIEKKIGVDPVSGGTIRDTSDNFFKKNIIKFDVVFIDGLHEYSQVKKDIENSLNNLNDNGVIFLHDCMPKSYLHQAVPRAKGYWNGDVWKNIVEIRTRTELDTYVICADQGIGMILKRPNRNLLNLNIKNFKNLKYKDYYYNYKSYLNIISANILKNIF